MRIVITKNGRILIQEINPENKFNNFLTNHNLLNLTNKTSKRFNSNLQKQKTFGNSTKNIFNPKKRFAKLEIDDVLLDYKSNKDKSNSPLKVLNLEPNKHLNMPQSIVERYFSSQNNSLNEEKEEKNILPDVLLSINKSIEKDASRKGFNYIYKNISFLQNMKDKDEEKIFYNKLSKNDSKYDSMNKDKEQGRYTNSFNLPKILPAYPLKYIISPKSVKNLREQAIKMDYESSKDKRLTEDNFRSVPKKDIKSSLCLSLRNEIKTENTNLIAYLNKAKEIKEPFVERLSRFNDKKLRKLNKISQKTMFIQSQEKKIKERIENTIKEQFRQASEKYKIGLENIKGKLEKSEKIINSEEKKIIDKKERYINQYNEAELNWVKSGALRFYNKGKPPVNCATSLVLDKE